MVHLTQHSNTATALFLCDPNIPRLSAISMIIHNKTLKEVILNKYDFNIVLMRQRLVDCMMKIFRPWSA